MPSLPFGVLTGTALEWLWIAANCCIFLCIADCATAAPEFAVSPPIRDIDGKLLNRPLKC